MTSNNGGNPTCGLCRENGRVWVNGYHGQRSLDYVVNSAIIKNVAAFYDYGVNLSECCTPVIQINPQDLMNQLLSPVSTSSSRLTRDLGIPNYLPDDITTEIASGSSFSDSDLENMFEVFFASTVICGTYLCNNAYALNYTASNNPNNPIASLCQTTVNFFVTVTNVTGTIFNVNVEVVFSNGSTQLASYTIQSNNFDIKAQNAAVIFTPSAAGTTIILGDSIVTFTQFPSFIFEEYVNDVNPSVSLRVTNHFLASCKSNILTEFLTCNKNCVNG